MKAAPTRRPSRTASVPRGGGRDTGLGEAAGRNLHERIADALAQRILSGAHPQGGTLPTELELCFTFGVSRSVVREAFRLLAAKRLIVSRRKVGTLVRPTSEWNMLDPEVLAWSLRAAPTDAFVTGLFEVREIVEPSAAALAASRQASADPTRIDTALRDMERYQGCRDELILADIRFHQAVLDAAGNPFLSSFGAVIESALEASFQLSWGADGRTPDYALRQHQMLAEAIAARQADTARAVMTQLLYAAMRDVKLALERRQLSAAAAEVTEAV